MAKPIKRQTWSRLDSIGLLNGISIWDSQYRELKYVRKPFETNLDIRNKILKYHKYKPDTTKQGLINALSNEFDFTPYNTLDSKTFDLTYLPSTSGNINISDIKCYYRTNNTGIWNNIPQIWSDSYDISKTNSYGFIVWHEDNFGVNTTNNKKNFKYTNLAEIVQILPDKSQIKFEYYVTDFDENGDRIYLKYTDINNPNDVNDNRFTYRKHETNPSLSGLVAYTLNDVPEDIKTQLYYDDNGRPLELLYTIKDHVSKKFKHKWGQIQDKQCLWDIHKIYGSGHLPNFYDSHAPDNSSFCSGSFIGYEGGVDQLSESLYPINITENSGDFQNWYLTLYPGKFYIDGVPFYYFQEPEYEYITFNESGVADLPSGIQRGTYTIMAKSGYYTSPCNGWSDPYLSGIYEDYSYPVGEAGDILWTNIYRRRPYLTSDYDHNITLMEGEYNIDFENNKIYGKELEDSIIIWDNALQYSGVVLQYDLNPLNEENITFEKFFLFLSLDNRY